MAARRAVVGAIVALVWLAIGCVLALRPSDAAPLGGTPVCGPLPAGTTTWNALGSPYHVCEGGVTVPAGSELVLSGSLGPVDVVAVGTGGLAGTGGTVRTSATTAAAPVRFGASGGGRGAWAGVSTSTGTLALEHVQVAAAVTGVKAVDAPSVTVRSVHVDAPSAIGIDVSGGRGGAVTIETSTVVGAAATGIRSRPSTASPFGATGSSTAATAAPPSRRSGSTATP